jgi:hypothetical protein
MSLLPKRTCQTTIPIPNTSVKLREKALSSTPAPKPSIEPREICFIAAGLRVFPSLVNGVRASREGVYGDVLKEAAGEESRVVARRGVKKGRESPRAMRRGRPGRERRGEEGRRRGRSIVDSKGAR